MGTKTRRSLSEADYSSIEVGELVKKTDQGKKRYALKKDGGRIYMTEIPLPGKDPGYRCPECKCIVTAVFPRTTNIVPHWRHEEKNVNLPDCSLRVGKNLTKFMRYLDPKKQQRERGILDIRLEKRGFSGWRARTVGDDKHGFPVCENDKNSIISFDNLYCHRRIFSDLNCKIQPAPYIQIENMFRGGQVVFQAAEKVRKKSYHLTFEPVKVEQIFLTNELLGSSGFTRIRPGSYYSNENDEIPNVEPNKYIGITKNRLWQSKKDGPKPNHEVIITSEKLCIWVYDLEYQPNIEFLKNKYAISVKREKDKDVKFEVLIQQPIESHPTKPVMVFLAENDSGKVIINHSKIDENGILTSFPVKSVTRPERKESDVVDKPKYVRPWREHDFRFNDNLSRQNITFESRGRYLEDFQPKPDYGITVKQKNHDIEVNFLDEITINYFPKTGDKQEEGFDKKYSFFELSKPIKLLEPNFEINFEGSLAALAQIKFEKGVAVVNQVEIFSIKYIQTDGKIGVIEGVRKLSDGIRAAEQQAENLQLLEITLDDKKTRYASNTLPKIRLDYGEINDREQERLKIIEDAARKKQQISDWRKEVIEKIPTKSPVAYSYSDDLDWQYGFLWSKAKDRHWPNILEMAKIEISRQYANKDLAQDVKIVRPLTPIEVNQYNEKTTEWAKRLQESKDEFEERARKKQQNIRRRRDIYNMLEIWDPVAFKITESWDYGFYDNAFQVHAEIIDICVSREIDGEHIPEISIDTPIRMLTESEQEQYDEESTSWAKKLRESKRVVEWREQIYESNQVNDVLAYQINQEWEYGFYKDCFLGEINEIIISKDYDDGPRVQGLTKQTPIRPINESESDQLEQESSLWAKNLMDSKRAFEEKQMIIRIEEERLARVENEKEMQKNQWYTEVMNNPKLNHPVAYKDDRYKTWRYGYLVRVEKECFMVSSEYASSTSAQWFWISGFSCRQLTKKEEEQFESGTGWAKALLKSKNDFLEKEKQKENFIKETMPYHKAMLNNGKPGHWVAFLFHRDKLPPTEWRYGKIKSINGEKFTITYKEIQDRRYDYRTKRMVNIGIFNDYDETEIKLIRQIGKDDPKWIRDLIIKKKGSRNKNRKNKTQYSSNYRKRTDNSLELSRREKLVKRMETQRDIARDRSQSLWTREQARKKEQQLRDELKKYDYRYSGSE